MFDEGEFVSLELPGDVPRKQLFSLMVRLEFGFDRIGHGPNS